MLGPAALALVVATALAWTGVDLLRKLLVEAIPPLPLVLLLTAVPAPFFAVWAMIEGGSIGPGYLLPAVGSVVLNIVANWAFIAAVQASPLSLTIPLLSLTPAFAAVLGAVLLGEIPSAVQWVGIALVVVGAFVLHLGGGEGVTARAVLAAFRREKGSPLMALVALLWSLAMPLDKMAIQVSGVALHALVLTAGIAAGVALLLAARSRLGEVARVRRVPGAFAAAVVVSTLALGLQLLAIKLVWVSLVETMKRGVGNVMALVFGRAVFGEPVTRWKVAAILLMAAGVALVLA